MNIPDTSVSPALQFPHAGSPSVYNGTGTVIAADKIVYVSGVQGVRPSVTLADADAVSTTATPLLVTAHAINDSDTGIAAPWKIVTGVDTSGGSAGDPVYLSNTAGGWSLSAGTYPRVIGVVLYSNATTGQIMLAPGLVDSQGAGALFAQVLYLLDNNASALQIRQGTTPYLTVVTTNGAEGVQLEPLARPLGLKTLPRRFELVWVAGQRGKPGLNADIQNAAEATRMVADPDFEILGTNASSDDVTFYAEGGIKLETDGADGDEVIVLPHLDANQSAWTQVTWGTDKQTVWECDITTGSSITNAIIWAGLKLTNTEVTATDNDQCFFRYEDDVNSGKWQAISSIGGTDDAHDSGVTAATGTRYHLKIVIQSDRTALMYINGALVETTAALTDATDLIPYIGVAADGAGAAIHMYVHGQAISRVIG